MRRAIRASLLFSVLLLVAVGVVPPAAAQLPALPELPAPPPDTPDPPTEPVVPPENQRAAGSSLNGTFRIGAGQCAGQPSGSFFRMVQPGGSKSGPFVSNSDSPCADKTYTPLRPGSDGGLVVGTYQPQPNPPFSPSGGGLSQRVTAPQRFYGVDFATATNATDPQTGTGVTAPDIRLEGTRLSGDLRAFAASWNSQHFNQGAPKPDGSAPGTTTAPSGNLNAETGAYALDWASLIVGGPFNNFTGLWHLEGTFVPRSGGGGAGQGTGTGSTGAGAGSSASAATATAVGGSSGSGGRLASTGVGFTLPVGSALMAAGLALAALRRRVAVGATQLRLGHEPAAFLPRKPSRFAAGSGGSGVGGVSSDE